MVLHGTRGWSNNNVRISIDFYRRPSAQLLSHLGGGSDVVAPGQL
jgi:hypothetical protein